MASSAFSVLACTRLLGRGRIYSHSQPLTELATAATNLVLAARSGTLASGEAGCADRERTSYCGTDVSYKLINLYFYMITLSVRRGRGRGVPRGTGMPAMVMAAHNLTWRRTQRPPLQRPVT